MVDSIGVVHGAASHARPVGIRAFPVDEAVRAHGAAEGYVVFALPRDRRPWKVTVRLAPSGEGELVWALPR
jgi:hypothetical protein